MRVKKQKRESKTMSSAPPVTIMYIKDESAKSSRRVEEVTELIFQMILLAKKRGRPRQTDNGVEDAA